MLTLGYTPICGSPHTFDFLAIVAGNFMLSGLLRIVLNSFDGKAPFSPETLRNIGMFFIAG
jgi:hypothetical protein